MGWGCRYFGSIVLLWSLGLALGQGEFRRHGYEYECGDYGMQLLVFPSQGHTVRFKVVDEFGTAFEVTNCSICLHWVTSTQEGVVIFSARYNGCHMLKKDGRNHLKVRVEELQSTGTVAAAYDVNMICPKPTEHDLSPEETMRAVPQPGLVRPGPVPQPGLVRPGPVPQPGLVRPGPVPQPGLVRPGPVPQPGLVRPGPVPQPGLVRPGPVPQPGLVRPGPVPQPGLVRPGPVPQPGLVRPGPVPQPGLVRPGPVPQPGLVRPGPVPQPGLVRPGPVPQPGLVRPGPVPQPGLVRPGPVPQPGLHLNGLQAESQCLGHLVVAAALAQPASLFPTHVCEENMELWPPSSGVSLGEQTSQYQIQNQNNQAFPVRKNLPEILHPSTPGGRRFLTAHNGTESLNVVSSPGPIIFQDSPGAPKELVHGNGATHPGLVHRGSGHTAHPPTCAWSLGQAHSGTASKSRREEFGPSLAPKEELDLYLPRPEEAMRAVPQPGLVLPGLMPQPGLGLPDPVPQPGLVHPGSIPQPGLVHPGSIPQPGLVHPGSVLQRGSTAATLGAHLTQEQCRVAAGKIPCVDAPGRTACAQAGCCYDETDPTTPCYYGNTVTAQCLLDGHFVLVVSRDMSAHPNILDSVRLAYAQTGCEPIRKTEAFVIFHFPLMQCGTTAQVTGDKLIYENQLVSGIDIQTGPDGSITRDSTFILHARCIYNASDFLPLQVQIFMPPSPAPVTQEGPLHLELRIATDLSYTSYLEEGDYPVLKVLRDPVYVEVRILQRTDPALVLVLHQCWATPSANPLEQPQWPILVDACPFLGDNYRTQLVPMGPASSELPFLMHHQRFVLSTFAFVDSAAQMVLEGLVYIYCSASACHPSQLEPCRTTCPSGAAIRGRRFLDLNRTGEPQDLVSSHGPVIFGEGTKLWRE
uniref:Zona pellucida glycoprotein 1 n=1 Tax=Pelodiscus sinensis TaxID=13735 RepID=K7FEQ3_PELSI